METNSDYNAILLAGKDKVKESKTTKAISMGFLPESGEFTGWDVVSITNDSGEQNWYYELYSTNGGKISMNTVQILGFKGEPTAKDLKMVDKEGSQLKGLYVLKGVTSVNPTLSGNQAKVLSNLIGKKFTTKIEQIKIVPFGKNTNSPTTTLKAIVSKDAFKIILD